MAKAGTLAVKPLDGNGVNAAAVHVFPQRIIHKPVPREAAQMGKARQRDADAQVAARAAAGVRGVQGAFVQHLQRAGLKIALKGLGYPVSQ
jgi:hypothetical protein